MSLLNKLLCKLFGHKWRPELKDMYCIRCGTSRPMTLGEDLSHNSLFAEMFSKEMYKLISEVKPQTVDLGFWDKNGEYKEDIQTVDITKE